MNAEEDRTLSREAMKGFFTFLISEKVRHQGDIKDIDKRLNKVAKRFNFSMEEVAQMIKASERYIKF